MIRIARFSSSRALKCGASTFVLGVALLQPSIAYAQQTDEGKPISQSTDPNASQNSTTNDKNNIVITGTKRALRTSQQIKRNADTVVDSITATDIGAFPDKSVAEALQRVPGITVNRFAATSDTAHFSAEPSGVIVRGLPQVRSEWNGRDTFSANSSRGLSWTDITPELLAGVDTYKNQTADMIEGGIAGLINLRTRVPFDAPGQLIQVGARANYGDLDKKWTPDANAYYSNRWQTGIGEIGIMGNIAYSQVKTRSQGIQYGRAAPVDCPGTSCAGTLGPNAPATTYLPISIDFLNNEYDRKRTGISAALQWRSNDHKWLATAQYDRSLYKNAWQERSFGAFGIGPDIYGLDVRTRVTPSDPLLGPRIPINAPGTPPFTFDSNGNFQTGVIDRQGAYSGWWGNPGTNGGYGLNDQGQPMFNQCYTWARPTDSPGCVFGANGQPTYSPEVGTGSRINQNRNMTQVAALNLKWEPTNDLRFNLDGQYVDSQIDNYDISIEMHSFATVGLDTTGTYPRITLFDPTNVNQSAGGLSNPNNWYLRSVMDHLEDSHGHELALRGDGEYDMHSDWLNSLKWGVRYSDREQTVRWSTYNWQNIANTWTQCDNSQHPYWNLDSPPGGTCPSTGETFKGYPSGFYTVAPFGADFFGGNLGSFPFTPFGFLDQHRADEFSQELIGVGQFIPICQRNGQLPVTPVEMPNSCFTPDEVADVGEKTAALYGMLKFGGPNALIGNVPVSGNIGLRYVGTKDDSTGSIRYPTIPGLNPAQCPAVPLVPGGIVGTGTVTPPDPNQPPPPPHANFPAFCYLSAADQAFASGGGLQSTVKNKFHNFLPSFNVRFDLSPTWLIRFAASKAISRPDFGLLKNFTAVTMSLPNPSDLGDPRWTIDPATGQPTGVTPFYSANAYNPNLKPTSAWQFDVSLENYFANVGQFSLAAFYKTFKDYIQYGVFDIPVTNGGTTRTVQVRGPANGQGAKVYGAEIAYQRFFDFLPHPFDGLGIQANATYVKNKGVPNSGLTPVGSTGGNQTNAGNAGSALDPGSLEGLSKWAYNLVGMYEKGKLSARLAYNWRSKYLVTVVDCCVYLPVWQKGAGYLDGSIRFRPTDSIELSLEASNLLNTKTVLQQQVADKDSPEGKIVLTPNGWFQNDRRFIIGVRWKMASEAHVAPPPPPVLPPPPPPATQTCANGSVVAVTDTCPAPPPPPPPPAPAPERGL